jgi:hypothetical protein
MVNYLLRIHSSEPHIVPLVIVVPKTAGGIILNFFGAVEQASIRAKVEHPFRIIKCQFIFTKARYRGLMKNDGNLVMLFALTNIARVDQVLRA